MAEVALTVLFWGAWVYFILPLISLVLWYAGISLFVEEMFLRGGIDALVEKLRTYGLVVLAIMLSLFLWTRWNQRRYGGARNTRTQPRPDVAVAETAVMAGVTTAVLRRMQAAQRVAVDFDDKEQLRVLKTDNKPARARKPGQASAQKPPS